MSLHRNAKLGLAGRYALVSAISDGMTLKATAAAFSVSPATAHRWWHRWLEAGEEAQADRVLTGRLRLDEDVAVRVDGDRLSAAGAERPRAMRRPSFHSSAIRERDSPPPHPWSSTPRLAGIHGMG
jgi:transposase-like protein